MPLLVLVGALDCAVPYVLIAGWDGEQLSVRDTPVDLTLDVHDWNLLRCFLMIRLKNVAVAVYVIRIKTHDSS